MPFHRGMCPEADRTMRDAFEDLQRAITIPDRMQLENLALNDVERAALKVEKSLAASQSLRNMRRLAPLFRGLEHYSHTIEVLCNGTPYLPWIWAPIKLVLEVCTPERSILDQDTCTDRLENLRTDICRLYQCVRIDHSGLSQTSRTVSSIQYI